MPAFMLGERAQQYPDLVRQVAQAGHAIGNHSWDHPQFPLIASRDQRWQSRGQDWARRTLTTIGEACRAVKAETLERMIDWVVDKLAVEHWSVTEIKAVLAQS